ncbi:MAG: hypothetical protein CBC48_20690 [bacterium TMED88]|nr:hypothetical protein [Deltaproteobacteria bacterium]OUV21037.1 MAG: hypothetical protein CBC48_20690 [bacterium TMED88]
MSDAWLSPEEALDHNGLRLVLTVGVPGPWGEAAKGLLVAKSIPFRRVIQKPGEANEALLAWTGEINAPQAVHGQQPALNRWNDLIFLAESLEATPPLIPEDPADRAQMFGLLHELCGQDGFGWNRRQMLFAPLLSLPADHPGRRAIASMSERYGCSERGAARAAHRCAEVLILLADQCRMQLARGSHFLIGNQLSALDIYWAAFAALVEPLPEDLCAMSPGMRAGYGQQHPVIDAAMTPELMAHRDRIYTDHLELPIDLGP